MRAAIASTHRATSLARFFPQSVADIVADTEVEDLVEGRDQDMAILFVDVRGFTSMAETLTPREIAQFLREFRAIVVQAIEGQGGTIDKFIGDGVMALFGLPHPQEDDAARAILAGRDLLSAVTQWSEQRERSGLPPVQIGIGVHFGRVFVGALGSGRLEFTVLGDTVNVASRLEQLTKAVGAEFIASNAAVVAAGPTPSITWMPLAPQVIRGHRTPLEIFAAAQSSARR